MLALKIFYLYRQVGNSRLLFRIQSQYLGLVIGKFLGVVFLFALQLALKSFLLPQELLFLAFKLRYLCAVLLVGSAGRLFFGLKFFYSGFIISAGSLVPLFTRAKFAYAAFITGIVAP